jgi:hypothetical protein
VDLDGDGIGDVLSGSWPGELYFFKGLGKGKYAAATKLKDADGKEIKIESASTVFACDWRGTGQLDLLVGCIKGHVHLIPNDGTKEKPAYGKPVKLQSAGEDITVGHGDSHPVMADWEGTGKPGLVVSGGDGSVLWYRNEGTRKEPKLAAAVTLVPTVGRGHSDDAKASKEPRRGSRAKVWVGDWNDDGRLDLLVGDFSSHFGEEPKLSEDEKKRKKELEAKQAEVEKKLQPYFKELEELSKKEDTKTEEGLAEYQKKAEKIQKKYKKEVEEQGKVFTELRKYQPPMHYHGYVWLYLREADKTKSDQ